MPGSEPGRVQILVPYFGSTLSFAACFGAYTTASGLYRIQQAGLDPLELILVGSVLELSVFLFEIPTGVVADVYSRKLSVIIGYLTVGAGFLIEGLWPSFWSILLAQSVWGIGYTFISGANTAWLVDELGPGDTAAVFLRRSQFARGGTLLGIALAMGLGATGLGASSLGATMCISGVGLILTGLVLALVMPENGFTPRPRGERDTWGSLRQTFLAGVAHVRERPTLGFLLSIFLLCGIASEPFDRLWELHVLTELPLPSWMLEGGMLGEGASEEAARDAAAGVGVVLFGCVRALILVLGIGAAEVVRRRLDRSARASVSRWLVWIHAGMLLGFVVFALSTSLYWALFGYITASLLRGIASPLFDTWTNAQLESSVRATVLSMIAQADALGQVAGGPALGALGRAAGARSAILAATSLLIPVQALLVRAGSRTPQADAPRGTHARPD